MHFRPTELDYWDEKVDGKTVLGVSLNKLSLDPDKLILIEKEEDDLPKPFQTIGFTSDGDSSLYLVRSELPAVSVTGYISISN
jgi:hypothetical protein